jgi:F-type H+-transporting ATPase subunit gamma
MASGKELRGRIKSAESTKKITKTFQMIATSKMKRAADRVVAARPYANALAEVISNLYTAELAEQFPLLRQPATAKRAAVLVFTTTRGLCGGFNANILKEARALLKRLDAAGTSVDLHVVGKKGIGFFRYLGRPLAAQRLDITDRPTAADAASLVDALMADFISGKLDAVHVVYAKFNSAMSTPPTSEQVLPVVVPPRKGPARDYLLFPSAQEIVAELLPLAVRNTVYRQLVETAAGEQGARRTAMKAATDNATDLISSYRSTYNRARQAQITQEIAEIVGGAAALTG